MSRQEPDDRQEILYRRRTVEHITGLASSTIYLHISQGTFPRPVRLGVRSVAWRKTDIDRWIQERPKTNGAIRP